MMLTNTVSFEALCEIAGQSRRCQISRRSRFQSRIGRDDRSWHRLVLALGARMLRGNAILTVVAS